MFGLQKRVTKIVNKTVLPKCAISEHILRKYRQRRRKECGAANPSTLIPEVPGSSLRRVAGYPELFSHSVHSTVTVTYSMPQLPYSTLISSLTDYPNILRHAS
jgi:hypothetical protein